MSIFFFIFKTIFDETLSRPGVPGYTLSPEELYLLADLIPHMENDLEIYFSRAWLNGIIREPKESLMIDWGTE